MSQQEELLHLFREISGMIASKYRGDYGDFKLTMPQVVVLNELMERGPMKISELAEQAHCSNSTVSGIVDRLERDDWVHRIRSKQDRRVVMVEINAEKAAQTRIWSREYAEKLFSGSSAEELQQAYQGLRYLRDALARTVTVIEE